MLDPSDADDRHHEGGVATKVTVARRRPIAVAVAAAAVLTLLVVAAVNVAFPRPPAGIARNQPAPDFTGTTLDGNPFRLANLRGRPVVLNFWGPSCVPCRSEFPLFGSKLAEHSADGLAVVGILTYDSPAEARLFVAEFDANWPTVQDPAGAIRAAYGVILRPQTYFIDRSGVVRTIQYGEVVAADFERQYATIKG